MADEGVRSAHQVQAEGPNSEIRNLKVNAAGELLVAGGASGAAESVKIIESATTQKTYQLGYKVKNINIANLGEANDIVLVYDGTEVHIPAGIAVAIPMNTVITTLVVKGWDNTTGALTEGGDKFFIMITADAEETA